MSRKRWIGIVVLGGVVALAALAWFGTRETVAYASISTGFVAQQTCTCLYVSGRTMDSCLSDIPEDSQASIAITASDPDAAERSVNVSALNGLFKAQAAYDEAFGCGLVD